MDHRQVIQTLRARGVTSEQLPDNADEATVMRFLSEGALAASTPPESTPSPAGEGTPAPSDPPARNDNGNASGGGEGDKSDPPAAIPSTAQASQVPGSRPVGLPDGTIVVDKSTWDEVARQAREGAELAARSRDQERDDFLNTAIKAGKFPPSRKQHYFDAWKADPEGTRGLIESLQPGLVPVEARGTAGTGKDETVHAGDQSAYDNSWLTPAERARVNTAGKQQAGIEPTPLVIQGGD